MAAEAYFRRMGQAGRRQIFNNCSLRGWDGLIDMEVRNKMAHPLQTGCYLSRSLYAFQVERWIKVFGRERLLVLENDRWFLEREPSLYKLWTYLGLPPNIPVVRERGGMAGSRLRGQRHFGGGGGGGGGIRQRHLGRLQQHQRRLSAIPDGRGSPTTNSDPCLGPTFKSSVGGGYARCLDPPLVELLMGKEETTFYTHVTTIMVRPFRSALIKPLNPPSIASRQL